MPRSFYSRYALPILMLVFFLVPFSLRGARLAMDNMQNDVRDWLPAHFQETTEIEWFWRHFHGERFILVSWEGCTEQDPALKLFLAKLRPAVPPSEQKESADEQANEQQTTESLQLAAEQASSGTHHLERRPGFIGDRLGLFYTGKDYQDWGSLQEKWLIGGDKRWYYLTPEGNLYRWTGSHSPIMIGLGKLWRQVSGGKVEGEFVASLGAEDGPWYYADPHRLEAQLVKTATTGPDVYEQMTRAGGVLEDDPEEAQRRLRGLLFGPDDQQTCLILTLTPEGLRDFHRLIGRGVLGKPQGRLLQIAEECGISPDDLRMGGPPVDNVAIDEEGTVTLVRLVSLSVVLGLGLAYACLRSVKATIIVFFVGGIAAVSSLAVVGWSGVTVDAVMMSMPSLVYVLGISGAVHLINYYHDAVKEQGIVGAAGAAVAHGWKPAVLCATTTALGLASLYTSEITPIRKFGLYSALAVMGTLILLFTYLPAALELWPIRPREQSADEQPAWYETRLSRFWDVFGGGIIRSHYLVASLCVLFIAVVGAGVLRINTSVNLLKLFDEKAKILDDYAWLEAHLGKLVPMEVVVKFDRSEMLPASDSLAESNAPHSEQLYQLSFLDRMELVGRIQQVVQEIFGEEGLDVAGQSVSAVTFAPKLPTSSGSTLNFARRSATSRQLEQHRPEFLASDYLREDQQDRGELWRISLRVAALKDIDYGQFVEQLKSAVEPVLAAQRERERILRAIVHDREGKPYTGARVVLLGVPRGATEQQGASSTGEIDQTAIFAETLRDLLATSRLRVTLHNPAVDPAPEDWAAALSAYDCVVLVDGHGDYPEEVLQQHSRLFLDSSEHRYYRSPDDAEMATAADKLAPSDSGTVRAIYTGVVPIVYKAQRTLLNSLIGSTFWSFVTITPLMIFVSRSISAGLVAMLPNVLPVFVIFGSMGWLGIAVDIGSMMTASIALGVAVDDTIHYLTWFRRELEKTPDRKAAILATYKHCATPTLQAAIISGLGLSVFAFSTFSPTQRFGYLMLTILLAGVVAELVFFPSLLAGPLGRVFRPSSEKGWLRQAWKRRAVAGNAGSSEVRACHLPAPAQPARAREGRG